jgi:MvdD-like protein with pre-ATP grasp domain
MTDATTLIVTSNDDTTADLVADALASRGGKAVFLDVGDFPINLSITGAIGYDGVWCGEIVAADSTVLDLESIGAVYYRRPTRFRLPDHLSPADRHFAEAEAHRGLGGLLAALPTRWVSHPARIADAEAKPVQLQLAAVIHRYLAAAGLAFGAFDFVMDRAGALWWMECNPNGEWGWLTECIDVPIAGALAELLLGGSAR